MHYVTLRTGTVHKQMLFFLDLVVYFYRRPQITNKYCLNSVRDNAREIVDDRV